MLKSIAKKISASTKKIFGSITDLFKSSAKKSMALIPKKSDHNEALHYFIEIDSLNKKGRHKKAFDDVKKAYDRLLDEILNNFTLDDLLAEAKEKERKSLAEVLEVLLDDDKTGSVRRIIGKFNSLVGDKEYRDVLCDYAKKMKIALDGDETIVEIETSILETADERFKDDFKKKSYEKKYKLLASINEKYREKGNLTIETLATTGILIIVKSLGSVAATTALDALISASVQAVKKWLSLGNEKKTKIISCIVIIALMRYRLKYERVSDAEI